MRCVRVLSSLICMAAVFSCMIRTPLQCVDSDRKPETLMMSRPPVQAISPASASSLRYKFSHCLRRW